MTVMSISPEEAAARCADGALLVDVRADHERALGMAAGALGVVREALEANPHRHLSHPDREVVLICQSGVRSRLAAEALRDRGFTDLASVEGGTEAWAAAGLPMQRPDIDADFSERYARHRRLPDVGLAGQRRLEASRVLLVGAGGLGSPAAYYLAAAGVGSLRIAEALKLRADDASMRFASALVASADRREQDYAMHARIARAGARHDRLLALNVDKIAD